jgi:uncharacterized protein YndB with AHSA1/START domain
MLRRMAALDRAEIDIAAPPERVWDLVTDLDRMGDWSPECYRCAWMDGGTGPRVGARFKGWNRQDLGPIPVKWSTVSTVTESERGRAFAFTTKQSGATWAYSFEPTADGGTRLVETRTDGEKPLVAKVFHKVMPGRDEILADGMEATLQRVKAAAETT